VESGPAVELGRKYKCMGFAGAMAAVRHGDYAVRAMLCAEGGTVTHYSRNQFWKQYKKSQFKK
jgi:hypothetical protein